MEGSDHIKTTPDFGNKMEQGKRPMQSKDLEFLLGQFIWQNKQSSLDKKKRIRSDLNSTLTQSGPDKEITQEEFNEAPRRMVKL